MAELKTIISNKMIHEPIVYKNRVDCDFPKLEAFQTLEIDCLYCSRRYNHALEPSNYDLVELLKESWKHINMLRVENLELSKENRELKRNLYNKR